MRLTESTPEAPVRGNRLTIDMIQTTLEIRHSILPLFRRPEKSFMPHDSFVFGTFQYPLNLRRNIQQGKQRERLDPSAFSALKVKSSQRTQGGVVASTSRDSYR